MGTGKLALMQKIVYSGILFILLMGLMATGKRKTIPIPLPTVSPVSDNICGPDGCQRTGIKFKPKPGYATEKEKEIIAHAQEAANRTIQSDCFRDFMLESQLNNTNGRTNEEVVNHLQSLSGNIVVIMYYRSMNETSAIASAYVGGRQTKNGIVHEVMLNNAYFDESISDCEWASTLGGHEGVGHSMGGYGHGYKWSRYREDTVPYVLAGRKLKYGGDVFQKCCK
jgi:hypothetical protein